MVKKMLHNRALTGGNLKDHPADKYRKPAKQFDPIEAAEQALKVEKKLKIQYKNIKHGQLIIKPMLHLPRVKGIKLPNGVDVTKDEPIFEVLMIGKLDLTYDMDIKVGDHVLMTQAEGFKHLDYTEVKTVDGVSINGYYTGSTRDVFAIVEYTKL